MMINHARADPRIVHDILGNRISDPTKVGLFKRGLGILIGCLCLPNNVVGPQKSCQYEVLLTGAIAVVQVNRIAFRRFIIWK